MVALLCTAEFRTCCHKYYALWSHEKSHCGFHLICKRRGNRVPILTAVTKHHLIPHNKVIVGIGISNCLWRSFCTEALTLYTVYNCVSFTIITLNKTGWCIVCTTLNSITVWVAEHTYSCIKLRSFALKTTVADCGWTACPRLTVHKNLLTRSVRIKVIKTWTNLIHSSNVVNSHKVKTETVNVVLACPIENWVDHILSVHKFIGCSFVTAARTVWINAWTCFSVIVVRNCICKTWTLCYICMVVNNIHYNGNTSVMKCLNHLLKFSDSNITVIWVRRIWTLGNIVVYRVITPVSVCCRTCDCFINRTEIIYRH